MNLVYIGVFTVIILCKFFCSDFMGIG